jgi:TctA family transporter
MKHIHYSTQQRQFLEGKGGEAEGGSNLKTVFSGFLSLLCMLAIATMAGTFQQFYETVKLLTTLSFFLQLERKPNKPSSRRLLQ